VNLLIVVYLALILLAFALAGRIDMEEQERLSVAGYVAERVELAGLNGGKACP
jgi:hypothetical protein